jgi:hypothetical protein
LKGRGFTTARVVRLYTLSASNALGFYANAGRKDEIDLSLKVDRKSTLVEKNPALTIELE